ncbi:TPA: hypothetical protein ACH3X1_007580 [Trebouxia sp. C0004]
MAVKHCLHFVQVGPGREGKVSDPIRCQAFAHVQIRRATDTADFRAAAFLRAASFYKYSPDRSQYAARIHQRMKGDAEWAAIEAKVSGKDTDYKDLAVSCYIATVDSDESGPSTTADAGYLEPSTRLPAHNSARSQQVVGTLDLNQGLKLPSEELIGHLPKQCSRVQRAYLSNVCTAKAIQRQGVAAKIIQVATEDAIKQGVERLYVHVAHDNHAAMHLYCNRCGFHQEQIESEGYARALSRSRRYLLCQQLI